MTDTKYLSEILVKIAKKVQEAGINVDKYFQILPGAHGYVVIPKAAPMFIMGKVGHKLSKGKTLEQALSETAIGDFEILDAYLRNQDSKNPLWKPAELKDHWSSFGADLVATNIVASKDPVTGSAAMGAYCSDQLIKMQDAIDAAKKTNEILTPKKAADQIILKLRGSNTKDLIRQMGGVPKKLNVQRVH